MKSVARELVVLNWRHGPGGLVGVGVDAEGGNFGFQIGNPDVFGVGVHSSAKGFDSDFNVGVAAGHVGTNADGNFDVGADVDVKWGPLPNFGAHVAQDSAGDIAVSGRGEFYIPTPAATSAGPAATSAPRARRLRRGRRRLPRQCRRASCPAGARTATAGAFPAPPLRS